MFCQIQQIEVLPQCSSNPQDDLDSSFLVGAEGVEEEFETLPQPPIPSSSLSPIDCGRRDSFPFLLFLNNTMRVISMPTISMTMNITIIRLPLPTLFHRLEAVHLGDLMWISVRPGARITRSLGFSRAVGSAPDATTSVTLYRAQHPLSSQPDSRGPAR